MWNFVSAQEFPHSIGVTKLSSKRRRQLYISTHASPLPSDEFKKEDICHQSKARSSLVEPSLLAARSHLVHQMTSRNCKIM